VRDLERLVEEMLARVIDVDAVAGLLWKQRRKLDPRGAGSRRPIGKDGVPPAASCVPRSRLSGATARPFSAATRNPLVVRRDISDAEAPARRGRRSRS
jgi:hypothetical protein